MQHLTWLVLDQQLFAAVNWSFACSPHPTESLNVSHTGPLIPVTISHFWQLR